MNPRADLRTEAEAIFRAAVDAVDPAQLVVAHLAADRDAVTVIEGGHSVRRWGPPTLIVGAGKAAARMAAGCEQVLGADAVSGLVVTADGCGAALQSVQVSEAGHPLPDARGEAAARRILDVLQTTEVGGVLCLISGGASALLVSPRSSVTLQDKIATTRLLLECGASIAELAAVRTHLSLVKGGGLLRRTRRPLAALILSDVPGDAPSTIGSGPTSPDPTTFAEALDVLRRYSLVNRAPAAVAQLLERGAQGREPETLKPADAEADQARNIIIGCNRTALEGAARAAAQRGWSVEIEESVLIGDTTATAREFGARIRRRWDRGERGTCLLAGGETTVRIRGGGRGGRNQEFALVLAEFISGTSMVVLSAGTDGIDGPTPAAGAFVDGGTQERARDRRLDAAATLAENNSFQFFFRLGDLFCCGPTGTNVMDIKIALLPRAICG